MNDSFVRTLVLGDVEISCLLVSQKGHSTLQSALPETLPVAGLWEKAPVPAALALQVLTGGPCLTLLPANKRNNVRHDPALAALHAECLVEQKAAVVVLEQAGVQPWELMLVPVNVTQGIQSIPAFWGFSVGEKAAIVTSELLAASRLPLVFDLDETLLVAYSAHSLENRLEALRMQRHMANDAAVNDADADRRSAAVIQRTALDKECNAVAKDLALLRQYAEADMLELDGSILAATEEEIVAEGKPRTFTRPVIRLPNQGVVFTRIDPERRETSMIMRTRPGWEALRAYLTGAMDRAPAKQRFELYVCTAAEREYALEAWRILDPAAQLIPHEQRAQRVVCVPSRRKKTLSEVLGLGLGLPSDNEAPATAMPLAVIVDDRLDVWEEGVQAQVLRVQPFIPHKMPISSQAVLDESDMRRAVAEEMGRVQAVLVALRANAYFTINEEMQQPVARLAAGMAVDMQTCVENPHKLLPAPPRIAALMKVDNLSIPRVGSRPAASLQPVDPRLGLASNGSGSSYGGFVPTVSQSDRASLLLGQASGSAAAREERYTPHNSPADIDVVPTLQPQDPRLLSLQSTAASAVRLADQKPGSTGSFGGDPCAARGAGAMEGPSTAGTAQHLRPQDPRAARAAQRSAASAARATAAAPVQDPRSKRPLEEPAAPPQQAPGGAQAAPAQQPQPAQQAVNRLYQPAATPANGPAAQPYEPRKKARIEPAASGSAAYDPRKKARTEPAVRPAPASATVQPRVPQTQPPNQVAVPTSVALPQRQVHDPQLSHIPGLTATDPRAHQAGTQARRQQAHAVGDNAQSGRTAAQGGQQQLSHASNMSQDGWQPGGLAQPPYKQEQQPPRAQQQQQPSVMSHLLVDPRRLAASEVAQGGAHPAMQPPTQPPTSNPQQAQQPLTSGPQQAQQPLTLGPKQAQQSGSEAIVTQALQQTPTANPFWANHFGRIPSADVRPQQKLPQGQARPQQPPPAWMLPLSDRQPSQAQRQAFGHSDPKHMPQPATSVPHIQPPFPSAPIQLQQQAQPQPSVFAAGPALQQPLTQVGSASVRPQLQPPSQSAPNSKFTVTIKNDSLQRPEHMRQPAPAGGAYQQQAPPSQLTGQSARAGEAVPSDIELPKLQKIYEDLIKQHPELAPELSQLLRPVLDGRFAGPGGSGAPSDGALRGHVRPQGLPLPAGAGPRPAPPAAASGGGGLGPSGSQGGSSSGGNAGGQPEWGRQLPASGQPPWVMQSAQQSNRPQQDQLAAGFGQQQTQQAQHAQRQARQQHAAAAILNRGAFQAAQAQQDGSAQQPPALRPSAAKKPRLVQLIENASASYGIENPRGVLQSLVKARQLAPVCPRTKSHEGDPPVQAQRFFTSEVAVGPHHEVIGLGKAPGRKEAGRRAAVSAVRFLTHSPAWQPGQDAPAAEAGPEALWAYSLRLVEPSVRSVHRGEYADPGAAPSPASDDEDAWQSPGPAKKERNGRKAPASSPVDNRSMEVAPGGLQKPSSHTPMGELRERGITEQNALSTLYQFYPGGQVEIRANESSEMRFDLTALVVLPDKSWLTGQGQSNVNKATAKRRAAMAILEQLGCKMAPGWQGIKAASEPHPQGLEKAKAQALHVAQNCEANRKQQERSAAQRHLKAAAQQHLKAAAQQAQQAAYQQAGHHVAAARPWGQVAAQDVAADAWGGASAVLHGVNDEEEGEVGIPAKVPQFLKGAAGAQALGLLRQAFGDGSGVGLASYMQQLAAVAPDAHKLPGESTAADRNRARRQRGPRGAGPRSNRR